MSDPSPYVGKPLIGGYVPQKYIARGRFAWVFDGVGPSLDRVAIKMLYRRDMQAERRFLRETKVLRQLPDHPNRVSYRAHGTTQDGAPWIAMEFIDGFNLRQVLKSGKPLPERAACTLMAQLCDGFQGLHKLGLAHRDINPDNIMVTHEARQVKLMDFGLVQDSQGLLKLYEQADILQGDDFVDNLDKGFIAGTPEYMAPEQISDPQNSDTNKTDTTADVFALGVIFYELLAGHQLFPFAKGAGQAATKREAFMGFLKWRVAQDVSDYVCPAGVSAELWSILRKSLNRDPRDRQSDGRELGADIRFYLETGQGVLDDDLGATIATSFDDPEIRRLQAAMTTGDFQSIRGAALAGIKGQGAVQEVPRPELAFPTTQHERPIQHRRSAAPVASDGQPWLLYGLALLTIVAAVVAAFLLLND